MLNKMLPITMIATLERFATTHDRQPPGFAIVLQSISVHEFWCTIAFGHCLVKANMEEMLIAKVTSLVMTELVNAVFSVVPLRNSDLKIVQKADILPAHKYYCHYPCDLYYPNSSEPRSQVSR